MKNQVDMFVLAHEHNLDMDEFTTAFLKSWLKNQLDCKTPSCTELSGQKLFDWMLRYNKFNKSEKKFEKDDVEWAGWIFANLSDVIPIKSRWIPNTLTFSSLVKQKRYYYNKDFDKSLYLVAKDIFHIVRRET